MTDVMTDTRGNQICRADFSVIASWVQPGERVLDLGCGDGTLLSLLIEQRGAIGYGIELGRIARR